MRRESLSISKTFPYNTNNADEAVKCMRLGWTYMFFLYAAKLITRILRTTKMYIRKVFVLRSKYDVIRYCLCIDHPQYNPFLPITISFPFSNYVESAHLSSSNTWYQLCCNLYIIPSLPAITYTYNLPRCSRLRSKVMGALESIAVALAVLV